MMSIMKKTLSERKREAILEAAKSAFKENGVQATSMDRLAQLAQVSKRTVYNHFATKEALVMELVGALWRAALVDIDYQYQDDKPLKDQLCTLLVMELNLLSSEEYIDLSRVAFGHFFYDPKALQTEMAKLPFQDTAIQRWLKAAEKGGKLKRLDLDVANSQLHNLIKGDGFWPQLLQIKPALNEVEKIALAERSADLFLSYYAAK